MNPLCRSPVTTLTVFLTAVAPARARRPRRVVARAFVVVAMAVAAVALPFAVLARPVAVVVRPFAVVARRFQGPVPGQRSSDHEEASLPSQRRRPRSARQQRPKSSADATDDPRHDGAHQFARERARGDRVPARRPSSRARRRLSCDRSRDQTSAYPRSRSRSFTTRLASETRHLIVPTGAFTIAAISS